MQKRIIDLRDVPLPKLPALSGKAHDGTMSREYHALNAAQLQERNERSTSGNIGDGTRERGDTGTGSMHSTSGNFGSGTPLLEWTALEYPAVERGPYWWLPPSAAALACVLFAIIVHSYVFAAFAVLSLLTALLYARRAPKEYRFAISREGVYRGETRHRFSEITSFWIFEHDQGPELSLETASGKIFPYLYLPLGDIHPNRVRRVLSDFLPEKEHTELFTDQIARSIGF